MEQQKITQNPLPNSQSNLNIADITNTHQKTLRSLHNISSTNINSKSKLSPGPQFVISYNFQNDPNCQVRTHNLLIGLNKISQSHPKKNTFRKNAILRSNQISNSHSNLRNSRNNSEDLRNKLIHVRSNQILSSEHKKPDPTVHSFYTKNEKVKYQPQSYTHGNTFWKNERNSFDGSIKNHEKYINSNVTKIAQRRSGNKIINGELNGGTNSIQKISRGKLNRLDRAEQKQNQNFKVYENGVYELPDLDILERDQSSRLTKRSKKEGQYNDKLENILRKVKRQNTRQNLKEAYIKQQPLPQTIKFNTNPKIKLSPQARSIHQSSSNHQNNLNQTNKPSTQHQNQLQGSNMKNFTENAYDPLKNPNPLHKIDPASKSISNHQRSLIQKENNQKPKRKYHHLIKNPISKKKDSLLDQFHRIESENQNEVGSSKKPSKQQIHDKSFPDKSFDYSINGHLNENAENINATQPNATAQTNTGVVLQKLQFNNGPTKQTQNNNNQVQPQKSSQKRYNYHAPTTHERKPNHQLSLNRQRLNSSINYHSHYATPNQEKDEAHTKRKVPADYKEFLRLLSEENQKRRQIQEMERQRQLSLNAQKTSRFQNIEQQNQHIKRILTPIGNSFMEQRRKRLSDQRKSKRKQRKQQLKNPDGSIIESDSQSSEDPKRSYSKKLAKRNKNKKNHTKALSNLEASTSPKKNNFHQSLMSSVEKNKMESQHNSKKISKSLQKSPNKNNSVEKRKSRAGLNSVEFSNQQFSNHSQEPIQQEPSETLIGKKTKNQQNKLQQITGLKIPQGAIQRAKSKRNFRKNNDDPSSNNPKQKNTSNGLPNSDQKGNSVVNKINNKLSKNNVSSKNPNTKNTPQRSSQQTNQQTASNQKISKDGKIKPVDKRTTQQKQRKFKNWNQSQKQQKAKKQQGTHNKKDKKVNQKDWKEAQNQKTKKVKGKDGQNQDQDQQSIEPNQGPKTALKKQMKKKAKKTVKKTIVNENGQTVQVQETDQGEQENDDKSKQNDQADNQQNEDQEENDRNEDEDNAEAQISKVEDSNQNSKGRESVKLKGSKDKNNPQKVNESAQNNVKKSNLPSTHQNVQISEKNNQGSPQQAQQKQEKQQKSHENSSQKQVSIQSKIQCQNNQNQPSLNANSKELSNPEIPQKQPVNSMHSQSSSKPVQNQNGKPQPKLQSSESNHTENLSKQMEEEKKQEMIQNVIENKEMQQNGFMEITESKFEIYNHESQKSFLQNSLQQIPQMEPEQLEKRAEIVKFLYSLPSEYQQEITKFIPNEAEERLITPKSFTGLNSKFSQSIKILSLKTALDQLLIFDHLNPKFAQKQPKNKQEPKPKTNFLSKLFEPYPNLNHEVGIWMYCVGVWRLIIVQHKSSQNDQHALLQCLQKAFEIALEKYYLNLKINEIKQEEILRMLTGLRISTLAKTKGKTDKIFIQIEYNTRKQHIIRAISSSESKFSKDAINCVRKIEITPTGQKVLQIVSTSISQIDKKPKFFWMREDKFLQFFTSFTIISRRSSDSYWTNESIKIKNEDKAVYMIDSTQKHTSGSITLYPLETSWGSSKKKCTIAFYKQIQPQVLKLVGKAMERLPQSKQSVHTSKLYFEFNIKGTYYVFLELDNGLYNVAIESNSPQTRLEFVEFVKKETNKNEQCEYVEIDKIFKKKPDISNFQNSSEFRQLMNFMKKTAPEVYQAK